MIWAVLLLVVSLEGPVQVAPPKVVGKLDARVLGEASGLVVSRHNKGVFWMHNDSGDGPNVFAVDSDGRLRCRYQLELAQAEDWEDIALGPGPKQGKDYLYLADTGNNNAHSGGPRKSVQLYRVEEPKVQGKDQKKKLGRVATFDFVYPDGAHDVEALLIDPIDRCAYVFTKRDVRSRVYRLPLDVPGKKLSAQFMGELNMTMLVGADITATGDRILLKNYNSIWLWRRTPGQTLWEALQQAPTEVKGYQIEPQGEAIGFRPDGKGFYTVSEAQRGDKHTPIYAYMLEP